MKNEEFSVTDRLFRAFTNEDLDDDEQVGIESFESRDLSCNWDRFSVPIDVRHRPSGSYRDGCYSISIETARYDNIATPCHDPIADPDYENYSHVEIRWLRDGEDVFTHVPHGRPNQKGRAKAKRLAWRQNAVLKLQIEVPAD